MNEIPDPNDPFYEESIVELRVRIRDAADRLRSISEVMVAAAAQGDIRDMNATYHLAAFALHQEAERHPRPIPPGRHSS